MTPTPSPDPPIALPSLDAIRAAIDATDERARLLRRLLRLALRLTAATAPLATCDAPADRQEVRR